MTKTIWILACLMLIAGCCTTVHAPPAPAGAALADGVQVHGWTILSNSKQDDLAVITATKQYDINHLELSHQIVMQLADMNRFTRGPVNELIDAAHRAGVREVVVWDHEFVRPEHYPSYFHTGPGGTINLDDPNFWKWFKQDYREMLDNLPHVNGVVLTFIETDTRIEQQYSAKMKTNQEKIAAVVNAISDVVIDERHLNLYARTFSYTYDEYDNIMGAVSLFKNPKIRLLIKETPHDFFLTHPNDPYVGKVPRPTLLEFDAAGEYNGQGVIATTWPEYILRRYDDLGHRPNVIGYTARTDRYNDTRMIGHPAEIDLYALKRAAEDPKITADQIYDEFTTAHYGPAAAPEVKAAFKNSYDIVSSSLYTLGTVVSSHSALNYDPYNSSFVRHVSGKWIDPPVVKVDHDVNREFHYWKDVINHIAPPFVKEQMWPKATTKPAAKSSKPKTSATSKPGLWDEVPAVKANHWIDRGEQMNEEYLKYIVTEKNYGVKLAEDSLHHIENARPNLSPADYQQLRSLFERTLLTAELHRAVASAYYGFRVWCRGGDFRTQYVIDTTKAGLDEIVDVAPLIYNFEDYVPKGQWDWRGDAWMAQTYFRWITEGTWPKESDKIKNPYAGMKFPYEDSLTVEKFDDSLQEH